MSDQADQPLATDGAASVTYRVDEGSFMRACHALWAYRAIGRFGNIVVAGIIGLCGVSLVSLGVTGPAPYVLLSCSILFVAVTQLRDLLWRRHYRKMDKYKGPITTIISNSHIGVVLPHNAHTVQWSLFNYYLRTDEFLLLVINQKQFSIIPISAFESTADSNDFEQFIAKHLPVMKKRYL